MLQNRDFIPCHLNKTSMFTIRIFEKKFFALTVLLLALFSGNIFADTYDDAWKAFNKNDRKTAKELFLQSAKKGERAAESYMSLLLLDYFDGKEDESPYFDKFFSASETPYPYVYALWFNKALTGGYGKKTKSQKKFLEKILQDTKANGTIKAAARYGLAIHYLSINDLENAQKYWNELGGINRWQFVGPFDNIMGSGFDKEYPPVTQAESGVKFTSADNSEVEWFAPSHLGYDPWVFPGYYVKGRDMFSYSQTFVNFNDNTEGFICTGFRGNVKIWLNDKLVISESEELSSELDVLKAKVSFKKGYNRILVHNGHSKGYSNFIVRLTDENFNPLTNYTTTSSYQPYFKENEVSYDASKTLALDFEVFFENKIKNEPENLLNYYMLCEVYLRNKKVTQAQNIIAKAVEKAPNNTLVLHKQLVCYNEAKNRTDLVTLMEQIRENDPDCLFSLEVYMEQLIGEEKYEEAEKLLKKRIELYGKDVQTVLKEINLDINQQKIENALAKIGEAFYAYPDNKDVMRLTHNIQKDVYKNSKEATAVFYGYVDRNFDTEILYELAALYFEQGENEKGLKIYEKVEKFYPNDGDVFDKLAQYYYGKKQTDKALDYVRKQLKLAPYHSDYWSSLGALYEQKNDKTKSIEAYKKALYYDPNSYSIRKKLTLLENKQDISKLIPNTNVYEAIKNSKSDDKEKEHDWYYIIDEKAKVVYPEGTSEEFYTLAVKVLTDKGIEQWKESSIPYHYSQRLLIEKVEVVKKNGSKTAAERNGNEVVFSNLEKGDAVYFKYKLENYRRGKLAKEFWDKYAFNSYVPADLVRYTLIVANNLTFEHKFLNSDLKPNVKKESDYTTFTWELQNETAIKNVEHNPPLSDIGKVLHFSSVKNWQEIADWYSDLSSPQAKADFEVKKVFQQIFPEGKSFTKEEKARMIYDYVVKNINYSSVSFRQSAYVPQKASKTIHTKLGDCKDVSTLYAVLAREAGLETSLVLINTRDNGLKDLTLPTTDFNHCIVKVKTDKNTYYLELTDANTSFASLPATDKMASILEIPFNKKAVNENLTQLITESRVSNEIRRKKEVKIEKNDLLAHCKTVKKGVTAAGTRYYYGSLSKEKQIEELKKTISGDFKNPVSVEDANFTLLDKMLDTVVYDYTYRVKNEVIEIGEMKTFKVPYSDVFVRIDHFTEDKRDFPVNFWRYENNDYVEEILTVNIPKGSNFVEIPKNAILAFGNIQYSLSFEKISPESLKISRKISIKQDEILPQDYEKFREFVNSVTTAESKYVAFK